jgi:hypothetical protein
MSTRCQILVEGSDVLVYRHSDGYPDGPHGVLKALKPIVANFIKWRGFDECYMPAHISSALIVEHQKWCDMAIRRCKREGQDYRHYESAKYLGHGLDGYNAETGAGLHGDIEFLYVVKKNGTIEVRTCQFTFEWEGESAVHIDKTTVKKTVRYTRKAKDRADATPTLNPAMRQLGIK